MRTDAPTRRRAITIFAAAAASAVTGGPARPREADYDWHGVAMGADATILFNGIEQRTARSGIDAAAAEIERLEDALSLFRYGSELRRLNRDKVLHAPGGDIRRALALALDIADLSGGLFDPERPGALGSACGLVRRGARCRPAPRRNHRRSTCGGRLAPDSDRARHDPGRRGSAPHAQRPRPGLCDRPDRGPAALARPAAHLRRSRGTTRHWNAPERRALAGRPRQCGADRTDRRSARDLGGRGLRARCCWRGASSCSTRATVAAPHTGRQSRCTIAPQPSPTRCRRPSMPLPPAK